MTIKFNLRRVSDFADCSIRIDNHTIDLGFIERKEAINLLEEFKSIVEDLEWFVNATEK